MARQGGGGQWMREGRQASASHGIEKTPQFRASMERFAERAGERLSATFGGQFTVASTGTRNAQTFAALAEHEGGAAVALCSEALGTRMAILFETGLVEVLISAMFALEPANDSGAAGAAHPPTALEMRMLRALAACLAAAFGDAFAPVADFDLVVEEVELLEDDTLLGPKDAPALISPLSVKAPTGAFGLRLMLPHPFLGALAGAVARGPAPGAAKLDPQWSSRMERRVSGANLTLTAILDEFQMSLADVSSLRVGHVLPLCQGGHDKVRIECGERGVFVCGLGERNGRYALEVEDIIARPVEGAYPTASAPTPA